MPPHRSSTLRRPSAALSQPVPVVEHLGKLWIVCHLLANPSWTKRLPIIKKSTVKLLFSRFSMDPAQNACRSSKIECGVVVLLELFVWGHFGAFQIWWLVSWTYDQSWKQPQHLTWTFLLLSVAGCLYSPIRNMCGKKHVCRTIWFLQNDSVLLRGDCLMTRPWHCQDTMVTGCKPSWLFFWYVRPANWNSLSVSELATNRRMLLNHDCFPSFFDILFLLHRHLLQRHHHFNYHSSWSSPSPEHVF